MWNIFRREGAIFIIFEHSMLWDELPPVMSGDFTYRLSRRTDVVDVKGHFGRSFDGQSSTRSLINPPGIYELSFFINTVPQYPPPQLFRNLLSEMEDSKSLPPGIRDPSRRVLTNSGVKDKVTIEKYGAETNGEYTLIRCWTYPGGGTPIRRSLQIQITSSP